MKGIVKRNNIAGILTKPEPDSLLEITNERNSKGDITNSDYIFKLCLQVDKRKFINSDINKVEVFLTGYNPNTIKKRAPIFKGLGKSKKNINHFAKNLTKVRKAIIKNRIEKEKKVTEIAFDSIIDSTNLSKRKLESFSDEQLFGVKEEIVATEIKEKENKSNQSTKNNYFDNIKKFNLDPLEKSSKEKHLSISRAGLDLAKTIQKGLSTSKNQNTKQKIKGRIGSKGKDSVGILDEDLKRLKGNINANIGQASNRYVIEKIKTSRRIEKLYQKIKISKKIINEYRNTGNIYFLYRVKDKNKKTIQVFKSKINIANSDLIKQEKENVEHDFNISTFRKNNDVFLKIINNSQKTCFYNVYSKDCNPILAYDDVFRPVKKNIKINKKDSITIKLSSYAGEVKCRVLEVSKRGIEYANAKADAVQSKSVKSLSVLPGITAKINTESRQIEVNVDYISQFEQFFSAQLLRKDMTVKNSKYEPASQQAEISGKNITLIDNLKVKNNHVYEYKVLLGDKHKRNVIAGSACLEVFEEPTNSIETSIIDAPVIRNNFITMSLLCTKIDNDADRLFKSLFGDLYNLFEDDLKEIKDMNELSVVVSISLHGKKSGEVFELGTFNIDKEGKLNLNLNLEKYNMTVKEPYLVKILPKIAPPAELLTKLLTGIDQLSKKSNTSGMSTFRTPAFKRQLKLKNQEIISSTGRKFLSRTAIANGKLESEESFLNRSNFDFYFDGSTGDAIYADILEMTQQYQTLAVSKVKIAEINDATKNFVSAQKQNINADKRVKVSGVINFLSPNIDFFIASYAENGIPNQSGIAHLTSKQFNYMYTIEDCAGIIDYYITPVYLNGDLGNAIHVGQSNFNENTTRRKNAHSSSTY